MNRALNLTLDSLQLPFTQVRVTSADPATGRIAYSAFSGWEPATNFNTTRNPLGQPEPLYAFVFRNGAPLRSTSASPSSVPSIPPSCKPSRPTSSPAGRTRASGCRTSPAGLSPAT